MRRDSFARESERRSPVKIVLLTLAAAGLAAEGLAAASKAPSVTVTAGDITDRRRNDGHFNELEVELKLGGDGISGARAARATLKTAVDNGGRDLLKPDKKTTDFNEGMGDEPPRVKLSLKNPSRRAVSVKEVSGTVEVFLPSRDPAALVKVDRFQASADKPVSAPGLKAVQAEVMVVSRKTYDAEKKKEEERRKKEAESGGLAGAMAEGFRGLFEGMFGDVGENDVLLKVTDKGSRIFGAEVFDASGKKIDGRGTMKTSGFWILSFGEKPPPDASLRIYVLTPKALVSAPFSLKDVALP